MEDIKLSCPKGRLVRTVLAGRKGVVQECFPDACTRIEILSENGKHDSYWIPQSDLAKVKFLRPVLTPQALQEQVFNSKVGQRLIQVYAFPPWLVTSVFAGLAQLFTEDQVLELFEADWLRDINDRWLEFGYQLQSNGALDADTSEEGLPAMVPYLKLHLFGIVRCVRQLSTVVCNTAKSDEEHLRELTRQGFSRHTASGDNCNCFTDSLITTVVASEFITTPDDRKKVCDDIRSFLSQDPGMYPRDAQGRRNATAYLEHHRHGPAVITQLMSLYGAKPAPRSFEIVVDARWDTALGASDTTTVQLDVAGPDIELHLFNWTGENTAGYHYDAMLRETSHA